MLVKRKVKLIDIAKKLEVSVGLVSVVLSGKWKENRISEALAKKVVATANEMGYQKNQLATSLRTGKSGIIGLVVADIANPFFGKMARFIEDEALKRGYQLMIGSSDEDANKLGGILNVFVSRQVDGLLIVPVRNSGAIISDVVVDKVPFVFVDRYCENLEEDVVLTDNFEGAYQLCRVLVNKGYKKIATFVYDNNLTNNIERINGYKAALKNTRNKGQKEEYIYKIDFKNVENSLKIALKSALENKCDAIFFANNHLGILSLKYLNEMNVSIPDEIGVVGFDNPEVFQIIKPGVTCFEQPIQEICEKAVDLLFKKIEGKELPEKHKMHLSGKIISRNSC